MAKKGQAPQRKPSWLKVKIKETDGYRDLKKLISSLELTTVCEEARCPNIWECWGEHRTATFMILGDVCTRFCRYCNVTSGRPAFGRDEDEPRRVADAIGKLELKHAVLTSVDRDDLPDFGSIHWAETIQAIRKVAPDTQVEVLIPDFAGRWPMLMRVLEAAPHVLAHNTETVPSLYRRIRPKGDYLRAMTLLQKAHEYRTRHGTTMVTKSGLMLGLGETPEEVVDVLKDLREHHCDVITLGQYLNPTRKHAPVIRHYSPDEFAEFKKIAMELGFRHCQSGPLVRSSYHAHEHVGSLLRVLG